MTLEFTEHKYFLRINGDTVEKTICCILVVVLFWFFIIAKLLSSLDELKVVLAKYLYSAPYATVLGWERAKKKPGSTFSIEIQSLLEEGWQQVSHAQQNLWQLGKPELEIQKQSPFLLPVLPGEEPGFNWF